VFKRAGLASAALYTLGAGLFPLRICFVFIAAAFHLLAYLFFKTGLEALQEKFQHGEYVKAHRSFCVIRQDMKTPMGDCAFAFRVR
jgi:hypothetical protein